MPIRTASLNKQIKKNGERLHLAMMSRAHSQGAEQEPSDDEKALTEERRLLKEAKVKRQAMAEQPKAKADKIVRTHHAAPKAGKEAKAPKVPKEHKAAAKGHVSRADKAAQKAAALEAAKKAAKKSAKT